MVTRYSKYVTFQLAEVAVSRNLFAAILNRIAQLAISLAECRPRNRMTTNTA